jgi:hypothetical protein
MFDGALLQSHNRENVRERATPYDKISHSSLAFQPVRQHSKRP